jgi:hypothetical protein
MRSEIESALAQGKRIIFAAEAMFTTATLPDRAYAARKENVSLEEKLTSSPAIAVVAGVSGQNGLESFYQQERSIDSDAFIQFLLTLLERSKPGDFVVFLDNCRVHHSKKATKFMQENGIVPIYNFPYSPEFNPIERVWAQIKARFKVARMGLVLDGHSPDYDKLVRQTMLDYPKEKIQSIVNKSMIRLYIK